MTTNFVTRRKIGEGFKLSIGTEIVTVVLVEIGASRILFAVQAPKEVRIERVVSDDQT